MLPQIEMGNKKGTAGRRSSFIPHAFLVLRAKLKVNICCNQINKSEMKKL